MVQCEIGAKGVMRSDARWTTHLAMASEQELLCGRRGGDRQTLSFGRGGEGTLRLMD